MVATIANNPYLKTRSIGVSPERNEKIIALTNLQHGNDTASCSDCLSQPGSLKTRFIHRSQVGLCELVSLRETWIAYSVESRNYPDSVHKPAVRSTSWGCADREEHLKERWVGRMPPGASRCTGSCLIKCKGA